MIVATNVSVLVACGLCMINNSVVILFGRFFYGMASGAYSVFCPKYVSELAPKEYRGPYGALNQFMCTLGILVIACLGIPIPDDLTTLNKDDFLVANYWRVCWGLPIIFSLIQVVSMILIFKYETPIVLKETNKEDSLVELLKKMYIQEHVEMRLQEVTEAAGGENSGPVVQTTYSETFCDPNLRGAAFVGCTLAMLQQLTGINAIIFYSSEIFASIPGNPIPVNSQTALVMAVNCVAVLGASAMLSIAGR